MIDGLEMPYVNMTVEAFESMLRAFTHHKCSTATTVAHKQELLLPMLHKMVEILEVQPPETDTNISSDGGSRSYLPARRVLVRRRAC